MKIFELFLRIWRAEDSIDEIKKLPVDMIVPICYAITPESGGYRLSTATVLNFSVALKFLEIFPKAQFAFGNCSYFFPGSEKIESILKRKLFPSLPTKAVEITLLNSIKEAEGVHLAAHKRGIEPKCILLITGEIHSRRARFIWRRVFPKAKIIVVCIPHKNEVEKNFPTLTQRAVSVWTLVNLVGYPLMLITKLPFVGNFIWEFMGGIRHPIAKQSQKTSRKPRI